VARYRAALVERFGAAALNLRCYVVVAVGRERMLGEEVTSASAGGVLPRKY